MRILSRLNRWFTAMLFLCLTLAAATSPARAISVSPLVIDMTAAGRGARNAVTVLNDSKSPLPVEVRVYRLELGLDGEPKKTPADDDFVIFPPQAILKPGATQIFRVQWAGDPALAKSQGYVLSVNQLPVKIAQAKSGVQVVFNFSVVVNVAPVSGQAELRAVKTEVTTDAKGTPRPAIIVENKGNKHAYFSDASLKIAGGGWNRSLSAAELRQFVGLGLVLPGRQRRFILPIDLPSAAPGLSAVVEAPRNPGQQR